MSTTLDTTTGGRLAAPPRPASAASEAAGWSSQTRSRPLRRQQRPSGTWVASDVALWVTAVGGAIMLALTISATLGGLAPLIVTSGSMEPEVPVGSVAVVRTVPAAEIDVGDVLWASTASGTRVLHRVVELDRAGDTITVRLQGDANTDPDAGQVTLRETERLHWVIPGLGYLASAARSPVAGIVVTILVLLPWLLRRRAS